MLEALYLVWGAIGDFLDDEERVKRAKKQTAQMRKRA